MSGRLRIKRGATNPREITLDVLDMFVEDSADPAVSVLGALGHEIEIQVIFIKTS